MHIPASRITVGAGLVGYGLWAGLNALGMLHPSAGQAFGTYWPLLIVLWGLLEAADDVAVESGRTMRGWPWWVAAAGAVLAASHLGWFHLTAQLVWGLIWAALIVGLGITFLVKGTIPVIRIQGARVDVGGWRPAGRWWKADQRHQGGASQVIGSLHVGQSDPWELTDRTYRQAMGDLSLDLTHARLREGETRLELHGGVGEIQVLLPPGLPVHLEGHVQVGEIEFFGRTSSGFDRYLEEESDGYRQAPRRLWIEMSMRMGDITVERVL